MHTTWDGPNNGYWSYVTVGSGLFLDTGNTLVFADHAPAFAHFGLPAVNTGNFRPLVAKALAAGYDTIQFTHRCEHKFKFEIVDVRAHTSTEGAGNICRQVPASAQAWRSGWGGASRGV